MTEQTVNNKPSSNYLGEEYCQRIRDLLELSPCKIDVIQMTKLFEIIDKGMMDYCDSCDKVNSEDIPRRIPWGDLD